MVVILFLNLAKSLASISNSGSLSQPPTSNHLNSHILTEADPEIHRSAATSYDKWCKQNRVSSVVVVPLSFLSSFESNGFPIHCGNVTFFYHKHCSTGHCDPAGTHQDNVGNQRLCADWNKMCIALLCSVAFGFVAKRVYCSATV